MKRKYAAMILGLTMALTSANLAYAADSSDTATEAAADTTEEASDTTETANGTTSDAETTDDSTESTEVYGEVTEVGTDSITINVGTMKEGQAPQDGEKPDGEAPSMLDLTGESQDIKKQIQQLMRNRLHRRNRTGKHQMVRSRKMQKMTTQMRKRMQMTKMPIQQTQRQLPMILRQTDRHRKCRQNLSL